MFGRNGDQTHEEHKRFECTIGAIPGDVISQLTDDFGITMLPATEAAPPSVG